VARRVGGGKTLHRPSPCWKKNIVTRFSDCGDTTWTHRFGPSFAGLTRLTSNDEMAVRPNHFSTWNRKEPSSNIASPPLAA
jgi:hypothetical protein